MLSSVVLARSLVGRLMILLLGLVFSAGAFAQTYTNPIIADGADPWIIQKDGFYYYTQTTGNNVRVRKAATITGGNGLANASAVTAFTPPAPNNKNVWAPELHFLNGKWYIYYAADNGTNANHRMYVAEATTSNPQGPYVLKGKIYDASADRWAIDGTVLQTENGNLYFVWSGWPGSQDGLQNLYIAPMSNPWTINGPRVLIATPTYNWEGWIHEGPQILKRDGKIHIVFSANASWTDNYCLGLLTNTDGNVLNPASWSKTSTPLFKTYSDLNGAVYGPGHCSFAKSLDGTEDLILFHAAKFSGAGWNRNVRVQRFDWNPNGSPHFDVPVPGAIPLTVPSGERPVPIAATSYVLDVNPGPGSVRLAPEQLRYKPGTVVALTAVDYAGNRFSGWSGDVWKTNHSITVLMDRNKSATANFTRPFVLLDNPEATFTGTWLLSTNSTHRVGADYRFAHSADTGTATARYTPNIPFTGKYDIYLMHSGGSNRSTAAPWRISSSGVTNTVYVNQQIDSGIWKLLAGDKWFGRGSGGFVQLDNSTGEADKVVIADAVAFLYSTNQDIAPVIANQPLSQTVAPGGSVTLRVGVPGMPAFQWVFENQTLPGATGRTLTINEFNITNEGVYRVVVSNVLGVASSSNAFLQLSSPVRFEGNFQLGTNASQLQLIGAVGSNYVLESSEDLRAWHPIQTNLALNGIWNISIGDTNLPIRFFRATGR